MIRVMLLAICCCLPLSVGCGAVEADESLQTAIYRAEKIERNLSETLIPHAARGRAETEAALKVNENVREMIRDIREWVRDLIRDLKLIWRLQQQQKKNEDD